MLDSYLILETQNLTLTQYSAKDLGPHWFG